MITIADCASVPVEPALARLLDDGHAQLDAREVEAALARAYPALAMARTPAERCRALFLMARCRYLASELDVAVTLAAEAAKAAQAAPATAVQAMAQTLEARCLEQAGETGVALDQLLLTLPLLEASPGDDIEWRTAREFGALTLGVVHLSLGDLELAQQWCERAVELARALPSEAAFAAAIDTLACVLAAMAGEARDAGDAPQALALEQRAAEASRQGLAAARRAGHRGYETSTMLNLAQSLTLVGQTGEALALLQDWERRYPDALPGHRAHHLGSLGMVLNATGQLEASVKAYQSALELADDEAQRVATFEELSAVLERSGRWEEALQAHKRFHQLQMRLSAERVRRSARLAAVRLDIERERARTRQLASTNAELRRRSDDLSRQALEDPLTGLPNRRQIDAWCHEPGRPAAVLMIDVDRFKQINDRHSHAVGDQVLRTLARLLREHLRPDDVIARLGGEEFVALLHGDAAVEGTFIAAERLRLAVAMHPWSTLATDLAVTVSIGIAGPGEAPNNEALLAVADRRLYAAKAAGRNRCVARD